MWLIPLLFIGLIVWAISGNRRQTGYAGQIASAGEALETLKLRLAKGEISEEEYKRLRDLVK